MRDPQCLAPGCRAVLPPGRPFCTPHQQKIPYSITKDFWYAGTHNLAVEKAVQWIKENKPPRNWS